MRAAFNLSGATRHGLVAVAEGLVVAGIIAALLLALSPMYAPARLISGTDQTYAAKGGNGGGNGGGGGDTGGSTGGGGSDSIAVGSPDGMAQRAVVYAFGDTVTTYSTLGRDYDFVYASVQCFANDSTDTNAAPGQLMYEVFRTVKEQSWTNFVSEFDTAGSSNWFGGGANCTATLLNATWKGGHRVYSALASASFSVAP